MKDRMPDFKKFMGHALAAAVAAGRATLEIYHQDFSVVEKADKSPLTLADQKSHEMIAARLKPLGIPLLSEEGRAIPHKERGEWKTLWIVDPLDGTKEFVKKNGEFTVNIALVRDGSPVLGVIHEPVRDHLYFAAKDMGAFFMPLNPETRPDDITLEWALATAAPICAAPRQGRPFTIVGSRSHATPELEAYVENMRSLHTDLEFISAGSSLKFCRVAAGGADVYPRLGPTMEWDTAAGHVIAECAGAKVFRAEDGAPLQYNKENLLNPWFIVSNGRN